MSQKGLTIFFRTIRCVVYYDVIVTISTSNIISKTRYLGANIQIFSILLIKVCVSNMAYFSL